MSARIGVISDTHGYLCSEAIEHLKKCTHIIHAGDIVNTKVLDAIRPLGNIYAVLGNCDHYLNCPLKKRLSFTIEGVKFFLVHDLHTAGPDFLKADIVIHGHLHRYSEMRSCSQLILNPGSVSSPRGGEPASLAVITIDDQGCYSVKKIEL